jgi:putative hydrolase of the HAD superfamily
MHTSLNKILINCKTLMLDMDGTILDLAYDSSIWLDLVPREYAKIKGISLDEANLRLNKYFVSMQGTLQWYSLDNWSDLLDIDILKIHEEQKDNIQYLKDAEYFLNKINTYDIRLILVTNSFRSILDLKSEVTGLNKYFDEMYVSHDFGAPKESQLFWERFKKIESFDCSQTTFVDDTESVLDSAQKFGIDSLVHITLPDSRQKEKIAENYFGLKGVKQLLDS